MSTPAAIRGPSFRSFTLGATLVLVMTPGVVLGQDAASGAATAPASGQAVTEQPPYKGFLSEPRVFSKAINWAVDIFGDGDESDVPKSGFFVETGNMITGSGWISLGPGYRQTFFNRRAFAEASAAVSWRAYKVLQGRFEFTDLADNRLSIGTMASWRENTQVQYWGLGEDTLEEARSQYGLKSTDIVGYARVRPRKWLSIVGDIGYLRRPSIGDAYGWFERDFPSALTMFPNDPGMSLDVQPNFIHGGLSVQSDTRDHSGHPTRGGVYRAAWTTYLDQDYAIYTFNRYEAEAAHFIQVGGPQWVFAFHGWGVVSDVGDENDVPFYLLPSLGGGYMLRSFRDYRFHDRNMVNAVAESRWALFEHIDVAAFFDAGNVARRVDDLNFNKIGYGCGIRIHTQQTTIGRLDLAYGDGGWNLLFRTSDPMQLKRLARRALFVPFVP